MRKTVLIALATVVLAACAGLASAQTPPRTTMVMVNTENAARPWIWVDQEPIIVRGKAVAIVWQIAADGYEFPDDGIVFPKAPKGEFACKVGEKRQSFQCIDSNSKPFEHKYTIKVRPIGKGTAPKERDPWVVNDY